ncbi:MAG: helix-turn-helix domain-containing protein [Clostridium sp.]|nr:helix-turn-helix domain-containing protein [Clostridium sp.]
MSANTFQRMKEGKAITTNTIDTLCFILDCKVSDIIRYDKPE